jgi:hypothetical protein
MLHLIQLLWNFGVFLTIIFGRGVQTVFFGPLRLIEVEVCTTPTSLQTVTPLLSLSLAAHARARMVRHHRELAGINDIPRSIRHLFRHTLC